MTKQIIRSEDLVFKYINEIDEDSKLVLDGVNIEITEGEFVAILGHNGSGKSTLAKHMNALLVPTSGKMIVGDLDTQDEDLVWDIREIAGMVFQNPDNQIVATIVEEDVAFGPENLGIAPDEIRKRVYEALEKVGMLEYKDFMPHLLSGGQKQRVAIASVLAMKTKCIILDEPTAMLDPKGREEVIKTIKMLNKEYGVTIVLITHYMDETIEADRVIVMDQGKIVKSGVPREIFREVEEIKSLKLDVPQMTELAHELRKKNIDIRDDILTIDEMVNEICL